MNCPKCGQSCSNENLFCTACGSKLQAEEAERQTISHCPQCGRKCSEEDVFCARCGYRLKKEESEAGEEAAPRQTDGRDLRPLSANPVRPEKAAYYAPAGDNGNRPRRKPLFEGYEPVADLEDEDDLFRPREDTAMDPQQEPTAVYRRRMAAEKARMEEEEAEAMEEADAQTRFEETREFVPVEDEFGWDEEDEVKPARHSGFGSRKKDKKKRQEEAFLETWEEGEYEDEEEEVRPTPKRKPLPRVNKPATHIRPVTQDRPREDPVFLFDDEIEEEEERGSHTRLHLKLLALLTLIALVVFGIYFFKVTDTGRRIQAMMNISSQSEDYILLGNYHMESKSFSEAADAYYNAFRLEPDDYDLALRVAEGLKQATDYDRAAKLYKYLIDNHPERSEAVDRLLTLYQDLGWTEDYEALLDQSGRTADPAPQTQEEAAFVQTEPEPTPVPAQQVTTTRGSFAAPKVNVEPGTYPYAVMLTLFTEPGAEIYYTLDGSTPTTQSTRYTGIIILDESRTYELRAVAMLNGDYSYELQAEYDIRMD